MRQTFLGKLEGRSMKTIRNLVAALFIMGLVAAGASSQAQRSYRGSFQSVRQLINRIENRTDFLRNDLSNSVPQNSIDETRTRHDARAEDSINVFVRDFDAAVRALQERFD